ncbi:M15 family metallopeptidase [Scatolibacter rhodanostii]|uniref:M15 family metallopeptidase n=1 Tax=Scatolibacter rhodanostii TaxID=2014781 RepID=UPI000C06B70C|nr:M15 family metallopeptidase [Scatolibacter rhodanostii]
MRRKKSAVILKNKELGHFISKKRLFIKGSKLSERKMRRAEVILRTLIGIGFVLVLIAVFVFIFVFLIPYLQSKVSNTPEETVSDAQSVVSFEPQASYDNMGLPILSNEINLRLINWENPSDERFKPKVQKVSGVEVDADMATALKTMLEAAKNAGYLIELSDGYVSYEMQQERYDAKVSELMEQEGQSLVMAKTNAKKSVPLAGQSDFQTGLCVKLKADIETFADSQTYEWLEKHMHEYGFIFRFPDNSRENHTTHTGLTADNTVIRYVGQENAKFIHTSGMCLEEYVDYLANR